MRSAGRKGLAASVLVALSCVGYDAGIDVDIELTAPRATVGAGVESASLLVEFIELLPCEGTAGATIPSFGLAYAHGGEVSADTIDVLETSHRLVTTLRPAPDEYCALRLHLGDAERDAATLTRRTDDGVVTLNAPQQDIDLAMSPRSYQELGVHTLVFRYDYTRWTDDETFASSFWVE
ncbi:MAG: hypothetical protein AB8H86_07835 [Polyangiales bacterium]